MHVRSDMIVMSLVKWVKWEANGGHEASVHELKC